MPLELNPEAKHAVVAGFEEFVKSIDVDRYAALNPNAGRVIIKVFEDKPEEHTEGLIITGDKADKQEIGVVVAVGNDPFNPNDPLLSFPVNHYVGDVVLFPEHFGHTFIYGDNREKLLSIMYTDLIARVGVAQ